MMESMKSVEDQFSKLHPSLPLDSRICIVGGGPSGLSAAYALAKLGYNNVTLFEKHHSVGGMCESVEIEGTQTTASSNFDMLVRKCVLT